MKYRLSLIGCKAVKLKLIIGIIMLICAVALAETPNVVRVAIRNTSDDLWPGIDTEKVAVLEECFSRIHAGLEHVDAEWFAIKATLFLQSCNDLRNVDMHQLESALLSKMFIVNAIAQFTNSPSEAEMKKLELQRLAHISDVAAAIQQWIASANEILILREGNTPFIEALRILTQLEILGGIGQAQSQKSALQIADGLLEYTRRHLKNSVRLAELSYIDKAFLHSHNVLNVETLRTSLTSSVVRQRYLAEYFNGVDKEVIVLRQPLDMKQLFSEVMTISSAAPNRAEIYSHVRVRIKEAFEMYAKNPEKYSKVSKTFIDPVFLDSKGPLGTFSTEPSLPDGWRARAHTSETEKGQ